MSRPPSPLYRNASARLAQYRRRSIYLTLTLFGGFALLLLLMIYAAPKLMEQLSAGARTAYQESRFADAERILSGVLLVGEDADALVLRGFARYQLHENAKAKADFEAVIAAHPEYADAWYGLVLLAQQAGDWHAALRHLERASLLDGARSDFAELRTKLEQDAQREQALNPAVPSPKERPQDLRRLFVASQGKLRRASDGTPFEVRGVNLGAALPGRFPAQFPDDAGLWKEWLTQIGDMGANVVRVYTILPPAFYYNV